MEAKKLSPTQFAAAINIQRSTLSHILSGRNNPSLDFIIKVVETFPDINLDWLARGVGEMYKTSNEKPDTTQSKPKAPAKEKVKEESPAAVIAVEENSVIPPKETKQHTSAPANTNTNTNTNTTRKNGIDSIIVLFSDGTYQIMK